MSQRVGGGVSPIHSNLCEWICEELGEIIYESIFSRVFSALKERGIDTAWGCCVPCRADIFIGKLGGTTRIFRLSSQNRLGFWTVDFFIA